MSQQQAHHRLATLLRLCVFSVLSLLALTAQADDSRLEQIRHKYRHIEMLTAEQLHTRFKGMVIVDVRNAFEYQVIHINTAVNIPLYSASFLQDLQGVRKANPAKTLLLYCNGPGCEKSYKAIEAARANGIDNIVALDAGIDAWAERYPEATTFLGQTPMNNAAMIPADKLAAHMLSPATFDQKLQNAKTALVDLRSEAEAVGLDLLPMRKKHQVTTGAALSAAIAEAKASGSALLIYDSAGTTVKWLQYLLEQEGVRDYSFLAGGTDAYLQ